MATTRIRNGKTEVYKGTVTVVAGDILEVPKFGTIIVID